MKKFLFMLSMFGLPALAFAASGHSSGANDYYDYYKTLADWASGGLGVGLATTMLLMGGAIGVAKCSPMPTLSGVAGAAFLHWAPAILLSFVAPPQVAHPAIANPTAAVATSANPATAAMSWTSTSMTAPGQSASALSAPAKPFATQHLSTKATASSDLVMWIGIAGAAVFLSLVATLVFLVTRSKSGDKGFTPSSTIGVGAAFTDPNGFQREASAV